MLCPRIIPSSTVIMSEMDFSSVGQNFGAHIIRHQNESDLYTLFAAHILLLSIMFFRSVT